MFSIPNIAVKYPIKIYGNTSKTLKNLIYEIVKITLYKERISQNIEVEIILCTESKIQEYNQQYLNKQGPTDIISISYNQDIKETQIKMLGTIFVCLSVIKKDGEFLNKDYYKHLSHLLIHSTLHLLGYNHEETIQQNQMEQKEINILSFIGIESPYIT